MDASLLDQLLDKVSNLEGMTAYCTIFGILFGCGLGIPIPEDLTIVTAGYLAYLENIDIGLGYIRRAERYIFVGLALIGLLVVLNAIRKRTRAQV